MSEKPNNTSKSTQRLPESNFGSYEEIDSWYRSLRPDRDINDVPLDIHMDAVASSILLGVLPKLPQDREKRLAMLNSLMLEAPGSVLNTAVGKLASQGPEVSAFLDLTTELAERDDQPGDPELVSKLLEFGIHTAREIRETGGLDPEEKLRANKKLASLREAELRHEAAYFPDKIEDFDTDYIGIVMAEANYIHHWPANESVARSGALFETMIGSLAKYRAWQYGMAREITVRHATDREDMPTRNFRGKNDLCVAHDIVLRSAANEALIQCKWNTDNDKAYEPNIIILKEESGDGKMARNGHLKEVFADIASKLSFAAMRLQGRC